MSRSTYHALIVVACVLSVSHSDSFGQHVDHSVDREALPLKPDPDVETMTSQSGPLSLEALEALALANNPTLQQGQAQIRAARGAAYQAGLAPNPVVGYASDQVGINGTAGELQGGYISQEFVTGGKLKLSRAKYMQRANIAQTNLYAQQQRVLNDVRIQFYNTLASQQLVSVHEKLVANAEDNLETHREMHNLGQTSESDVLRVEVELQRDRLNFRKAQREFEQNWRMLTSFTGVANLSNPGLSGSLASQDEALTWDQALSQLLSTSPELQAARQKIQHDQITLRRERAQPIPNLMIDVNSGRNFETHDNVVGVTAGINLPVFNRNRGTIEQAQADLSRSSAEIRRMELELQNRLATEFQMYETSRDRVEEYQTTILPKAKQAHEMLAESYRQRRAPWTDALTAQRLYLSLGAEYLDNLKQHREADVKIRGMLLTGGLTEPGPPVGGGHIDAVAQPR